MIAASRLAAQRPDSRRATRLFCALLATALALELRRRRAGVGALVALCAAGLLRPEAWLLSVGYLA